jgi:hypothetical protein
MAPHKVQPTNLRITQRCFFPFLPGIALTDFAVGRIGKLGIMILQLSSFA